MAEQWEQFSQQAQKLGRREILVQFPECEGLRRLKTCTVPAANVSLGALDKLKKQLAKQSGQSVLAMRGMLARRERAHSVQHKVGYYEKITGGTYDKT